MSKLTLTFKGKTLKSLVLEEGTFTIGSDDGNDLKIDSLAVAPHHATLYVSGADRVVWQVNPDFPLTINGSRVSEHRLRDGDRIGVGKHELYFFESADAGKGEETEDLVENREGNPSVKPGLVCVEAVLQVMTGKNIGVVIPLYREMTRIGSQDSGAAVIAHTQEGYFLSAPEAINDIKVNDADLGGKSIRLQHQDVLKVGPNVLQFFCETEADNSA